MKNKKIYSLCEAVADIAFIAGQRGYYSGDSRADMADFISFAKEFENIHRKRGTVWGEDLDYIESIYDFTTVTLDPRKCTKKYKKSKKIKNI